MHYLIKVYIIVINEVYLHFLIQSKYYSKYIFAFNLLNDMIVGLIYKCGVPNKKGLLRRSAFILGNSKKTNTCAVKNTFFFLNINFELYKVSAIMSSLFTSKIFLEVGIIHATMQSLLEEYISMFQNE